MHNYIDTHAHLYLPEFDNDRSDVIERALQSGVNRILLPNIDTSSIMSMNAMVSAFPDVCYPMMGLHPTSVKENYKDELSAITNELKKGDYVGVGEIGIDLYWDKTFLNEQRQVFISQLDLSLEYHLPVVIHARESFPEILEILGEYRNRQLKGIFHAFTGSLEIAQQVIAMGFKLGIGGILTYRNSGIPAIVREIPLEHLVLETDSPYLTPVPRRGKRNESSYIPWIAEAIQQIKNVPLEEVARITTQNAMQLFVIPPHD